MFFKNLCRFHSGSGSSLNAVLFDAWVQCAEGQWSTSAFYLNIKTRHTNKKRGTRKWMLSGEMDAAFGSHVADAMRQHKANDATLWEKETRFHPELPQKEETPGCFFIASLSVFIQLAIINAVLPGVPTVLVPMRRC